MKPGNKILFPDLKEDWEEVDKMMLYSCFTLLENYVEQEASLNDWNSSEKQKSIKTEIDELMSWWNTRKQINLGTVDEEENQDATDSIMLMRLILIRTELWS
ncbi:hypothetical protein SAMN04488096_10632 [Mesonia phycicola]|uniref:Uncharacterized protein n=1 Tax=Mesonia phycicola TaxID=579105 RepID=A0A1M6FAJ3_9FLAO|nr:hypothetical protein [Mesonia phycicola]SHI94687.1 hypothetical protein SAMN04488096_10632 [Mesonia phycicola]